jgi:subtilisin family serine protease
VTIISAKFLGSGGGTTADAVQAIDYFVDLKRRHGLNIVALNNSWGGGGYSQALHDAIIRAAKAGILLIAAAGNGDANGRAIDNDLTPSYPSGYDTTRGTSTQSAASYDAVISVAAIDQNGSKASFSNYGARTVDIGAPGVGIYSTLPDNRYGAYSGTSMATPHVAGAAALYASTHPGATALEIRNALLSSVLPTPSLAGITTTGGRLNLSSIIGGSTTPTLAVPTGLVAAALSSTQVRLTWKDNATNETGYRIEVAPPGSGFVQIGSLGTNTTSCTVSGTTARTTYTFRVRAFNATGNSAYSNTATVTTY